MLSKASSVGVEQNSTPRNLCDMALRFVAGTIGFSHADGRRRRVEHTSFTSGCDREQWHNRS
ncbi:hypothetical protein BAUCODRAFT_419700 [Baudoinia panamericana UAMH 10762]|uniref:Uncharacterized protein n=1 Tax=Baudoinia panamericana (strain UAMH 10762) TaxID=717646 RepID=M2MNN4_BAUPA|nr:uncharacterized protein BAUCODRAFT_419700 [Baudoinia panamericana UAMH 10762]EMC98301.1 hypothetical protein BAUCODRAFT_419700 [Baudoinia panamericana UAMH 10762]